MWILKCSDSTFILPSSRGKYWAEGTDRTLFIDDAVPREDVNSLVGNSLMYIKIPVNSNHHKSELKV
ncbi:hypothetical protein [Vibrio phage vB_VpaP_SJSY21]|nr:hypothetical protein [Vibrio phage vB_VpaP_SJSY21]